MSLVALDALGPDGRYRTRNPEVICDTSGDPVAELSMVPSLFVTRAVAAARRSQPLPLEERQAALRHAGNIFATSTVAGLTFDEYVDLTRRVAGLPATVARAGADVVAESLATTFDAVHPARPVGSQDRLARAGRRRGMGPAR